MLFLRRVRNSWSMVQSQFEDGARPMLEQNKNDRLLASKYCYRLVNPFMVLTGRITSPKCVLKGIETPIFVQPRTMAQKFRIWKNASPSSAATLRWEQALKHHQSAITKLEEDHLEIEFGLARNSFRNLKLKKELEELNRKTQIQYEWNQFYNKLKIQEILAPLRAQVKGTQFQFEDDVLPDPEPEEEEKQKEEEKKEEEEISTKNKEQGTAQGAMFTIDDAMRILGFTERPTVKSVQARSDHLMNLNDPDKGGSPYLQRKVREAADKVGLALAKGTLPKSYVTPAVDPDLNEEEPAKNEGEPAKNEEEQEAKKEEKENKA